MSDGVLLLGFGGVTDTCCGRLATCPGRVECFVSKVLGDDPRQAARVAEVAAHYHHLGGTSPYNPATFAQARALEAELERRGQPMPVRCGFRNWPPWYAEGIRALRAAGCTQMRFAILSLHQCSRSWDDYIQQATETNHALGSDALPIVGTAEPLFDDAGYAAAAAARIQHAVTSAGWDDARFAAARLVLTAHAIPRPAEERSPYRDQVFATAARVAAAAGHPEHVVAFQSAPDASRIPWSTPRVEDEIARAASDGVRDVVVQASGFLVDHVEVLYDIDTEVRAQCADLGLGFARATCVHEHPAFIDALATSVLAL